ncbi:MAG: VWA domain-containing protein [Opitutaceae bacterium]|nr:VWA domain-containing protein [Verrucomicrobiales bacterium]
MSFQFTNPEWLWLLPPALIWVVWLAWKSDVQIGVWRRWTAFLLRLVVVLAVLLAMAGLQWREEIEGMNIYFALDRSESVPSQQQEAARIQVNKFVALKNSRDKGGVVVFGADASLESMLNPAVALDKIQAVVSPERSDLAGAIRLGTAAFPEGGQKRIVLFSDGNENIGDAMSAVVAARPLGVTVDVVPLGATRGGDVAVQKVTLPSAVKKGQTFEAKIFAQSDQPRRATIRLYRNDQLLGEQPVDLLPGKNLFSFPQTLQEPGFYSYNVQLDAPGDVLPQNNRATSFTSVRGDPRILIISSDPNNDATLANALKTSKLEIKLAGLDGFPSTLAEMQSYDTIFLSNIAAGDLGMDSMRLLESAVRDFGVGLVCVGGDQAFAAGGYRGTPLEAALPVDMELNSKKVLPSGAIVLVVHATEFPNGNQWARDIAFAALDALGPQDEMGIVLWDGVDRWLFELTKVGDKKDLGRQIAGMNPGDMPSFGHVMQMAHDGLKKSTANLKHMVVFSDGDPGAPTQQSLQAIIGDRITISTVMIGGHVAPQTMEMMADVGKGRFYDVRSPGQLPQIFIKEAAVILKSAIFEEPFRPQVALSSELIRGISAAEFPLLKGYVCTTPKSRAEIPLVSDKGDPVLAHWQYGLGRTVAFTSDAKAKWAANWTGWDKYRQFWSQVAQWSLRRVDTADFTTEVSIDDGEGHLSVEAVDAQGNYRNFLNLQTVVISPKGERQVVRLEQK